MYVDLKWGTTLIAFIFFFVFLPLRIALFKPGVCSFRTSECSGSQSLFHTVEKNTAGALLLLQGVTVIMYRKWKIHRNAARSLIMKTICHSFFKNKSLLKTHAKLARTSTTDTLRKFIISRCIVYWLLDLGASSPDPARVLDLVQELSWATWWETEWSSG